MVAKSQVQMIQRLLIAIALSAAAAVLPGIAAADLAKKVKFDIAPQQLPSALLKYSEQCGVQVTSPGILIEGKSSRGVVGTFEARGALEQLLKDTNLRFDIVGANTVLILGTETKPTATAAIQQNTPEGAFRLTQAQSSAAQTEGAGGNVAGMKELMNEEIVVTAQKRRELLKDVPMQISVLSGADLDGSTQTVRDAIGQVPGVTTLVAGTGGDTQLVVRGVTAGSPGLIGSSTVGYYLDSMPFGMVRSATVPDVSPYDLERVEILRGPQGTLYGAGSVNGVVRILTHDADLERAGGKFRALGSNTQDGGENFRGDMAFNVPLISGKLAVRGVVSYEDQSGWIDRPNREDANASTAKTARLKFNAQPTDQLSLGLTAWSSRADSDARSTGGRDRTSIARQEEPTSTDYDLFGLKIGYDFPGFSLSSTTSYVDYENVSQLDYVALFGSPAGTILFTTFDSKVAAQEINLTSTLEGSWRWTAGGIYRDGKDRFKQYRLGYLNPAGNRFNDGSQSFAVFGELTRLLSDGRFELTGGLRYFEDKQVMQEISRLDQISVTPFRRESKFHALSPRATVTWHASDQILGYASYSEGFRSGFSQIAQVLVSAPEFAPAKPDNLRNYEVGMKGSLWGGRLAYEAAVFYLDWQDVQQSLLVSTTTGSGTFVNVSAGINGESASGTGFEVGLTARPLTGLTLGANYSLNDLQLDADVRTATGTLVFLKGDRLLLSPKQTVNATANYSFPLGATGYDGRFSGSVSYHSALGRRALIGGVSTFVEADNILTSRVSFAVNSSDRWSTTLFVDNLNDQKGSSYADPSQTLNAQGGNVRLRPRTVGLQFEYSYR